MQRPPLLSVGFRPFFLAASGWAVIALLLWLGSLADILTLPTRFEPLAWHIHEMLFGFIMAGIAGFLLTAISNWTGRPPVSGRLLAALVGLWALGRMACLTSDLLPPWLAVAGDLAFPVVLEAVLARELIQGGNRRNFPLLVPVALLGIASLLMHLQSLDIVLIDDLGWRLGLACVMVLITVIGGRIIPAFTRNWLKPRNLGGVPMPGRIDVAALAASAAALFAWSALPDAIPVGIALLAASALHAVRLARWRGAATVAEPLLVVLHVGYLWLVAALALLGLSVLTPVVPPVAATHAMTAGAAGMMMLAVMTRVTLGHTGRTLHADGLTVTIYVLGGLAAVLRLAAAWDAGPVEDLLGASAICWIAAFSLFALRYGPMLVRKRP